MPLPMLPQDKANNLVYGAVIFEVAVVLGATLSIAAAITSAAACLKELLDYFVDRHYAKAGVLSSPRDVKVWGIFTTVFGGAALYLVNLLAYFRS